MPLDANAMMTRHHGDMTPPDSITSPASRSSITRYWTPLAVTYLVLALLGLIGTWTYNALAIVRLRNFAGDWVNSGPASPMRASTRYVTARGVQCRLIEEREPGVVMLSGGVMSP